ncbi:GNAT family N-acetyltransferase [Pedobacter psychroterrae]|uniref:N-acetyltransferase n=1 Tax=Pedobacter psychroterrae TaxID=2530453 RepID=A0A4R0NAZ8_9SPHI|nr:GNAT family N-acetyltransferase [Pedobacter psychroterrae]TCC97459.1 N-acetyltransferase [Pedobacter psychroterrae]
MIKFDFTQDYTLENEVALLRPLSLQDLPELLYIAGQPEVWKYSTLKADTAADLGNYIDSALANRVAEKEYPFVIIDKRTNGYAGSTRFYDIKLNQHNVSLGYTWYATQHQGTGLNKHCKYLLLDFAFQQGFERVEFAADTLNERSIAAMKSIGCMQEGILRSHTIRQDGSRRDTIVLSMLKPEWDQYLKERLQNKLK